MRAFLLAGDFADLGCSAGSACQQLVRFRACRSLTIARPAVGSPMPATGATGIRGSLDSMECIGADRRVAIAWSRHQRGDRNVRSEYQSIW